MQISEVYSEIRKSITFTLYYNDFESNMKKGFNAKAFCQSRNKLTNWVM